jgi:hypothetical protein
MKPGPNVRLAGASFALATEYVTSADVEASYVARSWVVPPILTGGQTPANSCQFVRHCWVAVTFLKYAGKAKNSKLDWYEQLMSRRDAYPPTTYEMPTGAGSSWAKAFPPVCALLGTAKLAAIAHWTANASKASVVARTTIFKSLMDAAHSTRCTKGLLVGLCLYVTSLNSRGFRVLRICQSWKSTTRQSCFRLGRRVC